MENEKAAVKRSLAQEARFREEKQQIVASMGGSPVELLTPSADSRLQRKLQKNSKRGSSSLLARDSDNEYQDVLLSTPLSELAAQRPTGVVVDDVVMAYDDHPVPLNHTAEREEYQEDEERRERSSKCNNKMYLLSAGAVLALTIGSTIGVLAALLTSPSSTSPPSTSDGGGGGGVISNAANEQCELDRVALSRCANDILPLPDCAKSAYLALADTYMLNGEETCSAVQKGLVALAVAQTNYGGDLLDPTMFYAMSILYFALEGVNWRDESGWLKGSSPCTDAWYGVYCSPSGLINLDLGGNRLQGTTPTEIGLLSNLETFSITGNDVSGSLPSEIGLLSKLTHMSVGLTQVYSSIPSEIGKLQDLVQLRLANCPLTGTIPSELGNLVNLEVLALDGNQFTGTIPEELEGLDNLRNLGLDNLNGISGTFPSNLFARLSNLEKLSLNLPGIDSSPAILQGIYMLTSIQHLVIRSTDLSASLPTEIGCLSHLVRLSIVASDIEGTIPSEIGLLTKLTRLGLYLSPSLSGQLPSELGNLSNLEILDLSATRISGTIPTEICALNLPYRDSFCTDEGYSTCSLGVIDTCS